MTEHRLHPFAALRVLRKTLVLYLVPLLRVLFERNWAALRAALRQDLILFLLVCALSWVILHASSWSLDESGTFCLHWKLLFRFDRTVRGASLAALTIERPFYYRLAGASRVTLYPVGEPKQRTLTLCLRRADAQHLADQLLPIEAPSLHRPKGGERAALGLLGANSLSTLALFLLAIRQTQQGPDRYELAFAQINFLAGLAARWLPAGAAWLLAFSGFLLGLSLLRSFVQTVHYEVWHTSTQIGSRGGWLDRFECRVKSDQISFADVRLSPFARLMRCWPVFVTAGSCSPELPLFVYRSGEEALFRELLPEFRMPPDLLARTEQRSLIFFAPAGAPFVLCALLTLLSRSTLPGLTVTLLFPTLFFAAGLAGCFRRCGQSLGDGSGGFLCKFREVTLCAQEKVLFRLHSLGKGAAQFRVKRQAHHPCGQRHQQHHRTKKHLPPQQGVSPVFTGWTRGRRILAFALRCGIFPHGPHLLLPDCMQAGSQIEHQYKSSGSPCVRHKLSPAASGVW